MQKLVPQHSHLESMLSLLVSSLLLVIASAASADALKIAPVMGNDDENFVFMGRCPSGEIYRLKAYQKLKDGALYSFYDYEGPAGKGSVQTKTSPKILMVRVCRALAEIRNDF